MGGDETSGVNKDLCKIIHKQVEEKFEAVDDHLEKVDDSLASLAKISEENQTIIKILMEERSARMLHPSTEQNTKEKFWMQPWFKYIVFTCCALALVLVLAAVGDNMIDKYIAAMKVIPH